MGALLDHVRSYYDALNTGDPEQVAEKILTMREQLGIERFLLHVSVGTLPHAQVLKAIELLGTSVAPLVQAEVAGRAPVPA